ncbi:BTAD domain-containing putative transcriptional regulator [Amycolatopsis sp. NPDC051045]|uniref:AfsR/SARP family transcriptional regulator n=1 Tax=Amycolatopsis sp. NPDC051045 TaxID=3156922 RepID=UPI003413C46F
MGTSDLRFGILGPLEVTRGGTPVPVNGPKLRIVLAALLLRANATVTFDRLAEDLWGGEQPPTARKSAQLYAQRLRRALGEALIETRPDGYLLRLEPGQSDLERFRSLVERAREADPETERTLLAEALACGRGAPLADIPSESLQRDEAAPLAEELLRTRERYLEVSLELGKHREIVGELGTLTRQHPWQESFWALYILALHRCGRQADALETYRDVHRMLAEELGVEPGPRLRAAHRAILSGPEEPAAVEPLPAVCQLPADLPSFSGRTSDLAKLDALLGDPPGDRTLAIAGPGGIGKTALAVHWAHRMAARFPDGQLFVDLRGYASTSPLSKTQALTLCLRALGVSALQVPVTLDEQVVLYRTLLAGRRVLVVLDNAAGADQVRPLLPPHPGCAALVTSRGDLRGLTVLNDARVLALDVLTTSDTRTLLTDLLGPGLVDAEPQAVDRLADLCGHLPLALRIAAANLVGGKYSSIGDYVAALRADPLAELAIEGDPDVAVRATFQLSYQALDEPARRVFRLLGRIPGPDFGLAAAEALAGPDTRRCLDRLVAASLLTRRSATRFQFHDLLREYAADRARADEVPGELAAADARLYEYYLDTAVAATQRLYPLFRRILATSAPEASFEDDEPAMRWLGEERPNLVAAVERAARSPELRRYSTLLADTLRGYYAGRGLAADGLAVANAALGAARDAGDRLAEVSVLVLRGTIAYYLSDYDAAIARYEEALECGGTDMDPAAESEARHGLGRVYSQLGRPRDGMRHHERALAIARQTGDLGTEARETNYIGVSLLSLGRVETAIRWHTEAVELSERSGNRYVRLLALNGLGLAHWTAGRMRESAECHEEGLLLCEQWGLWHMFTNNLVCLAETYCDLGRYGDAEKCARQALEKGRELGERRQEAGALEILATVARRRGRIADSIEGYSVALELARKIHFRYGETSVLIGLAAAHRAIGHPSDAVTHTELALAKMNETGMRVLECAALTELAAACLDLGDRPAASRYIARALKGARENGQQLHEARALRVAAAVQESRGDTAAASELRAAALEIFTVLGVPEASEPARG